MKKSVIEKFIYDSRFGDNTDINVMVIDKETRILIYHADDINKLYNNNYTYITNFATDRFFIDRKDKNIYIDQLLENIKTSIISLATLIPMRK